jgi:hypothetical protein
MELGKSLKVIFVFVGREIMYKFILVWLWLLLRLLYIYMFVGDVSNICLALLHPVHGKLEMKKVDGNKFYFTTTFGPEKVIESKID